MDLATPLITQGTLGVAVVALSMVVIYQNKRVERLEKEKTDILIAWRTEIKEAGEDALEIVRGNSQATMFLADKIEVGKSTNKRQK